MKNVFALFGQWDVCGETTSLLVGLFYTEERALTEANLYSIRHKNHGAFEGTIIKAIQIQ